MILLLAMVSVFQIHELILFGLINVYLIHHPLLLIVRIVPVIGRVRIAGIRFLVQTALISAVNYRFTV